MKIQKVGVVGCGTMGGGIGYLCAKSGYQVTISEINQSLLNRGLDSINNSLSKSLEKGKISPEEKRGFKAA